MLQKEVFVAPFLEPLIAIAFVGRAGARQRGVKLLRRSLVGIDRGQIGTATEPGFAGDDVARVHMRRRDERRAHMGDERDAARPEARILRGARDLVAQLGREFARYGRDVNPDLLENLPAQDRNRPAASSRPLPVLAIETARRPSLGACAGEFVLDRLELGADAVAELGKPRLGHRASAGIGREGERLFDHGSGNNPEQEIATKRHKRHKSFVNFGPFVAIPSRRALEPVLNLPYLSLRRMAEVGDVRGHDA